jgi:hypothetical protein
MFSQSMSTSAPKYEDAYPTTINNKKPVAGGSLQKGLDYLTKVMERKVDRQVMNAQIRSYDQSEVVPKKVRFT